MGLNGAVKHALSQCWRQHSCSFHHTFSLMCWQRFCQRSWCQRLNGFLQIEQTESALSDALAADLNQRRASPKTQRATASDPISSIEQPDLGVIVATIQTGHEPANSL